MKKLRFSVVLGLFVSISLGFTQSAKADAVYTFMNGQGYDPSFSLTVPRYAFLGDGSGWDYQLNQATTLSSVLGIDAKTPTTITVVSGLPSADVCKNIEGSQTVIPAGMSADGAGNCVVPTPVLNTPVISSPVASGAVLPKIVGFMYWSCPAGLPNISYCKSYGSVPSSYSDRAVYPTAGPGGDNLSLVTNIPTTLNITFTSASSTVTYTDGLTDVHNIVGYSAIPLEKGVTYKMDIQVIDSFGNIAPQTNLTDGARIGW